MRVDLTGFDGLSQRIESAGENKFKLIDAEIGASVRQMARNAKRDAPNDQGLLASEISFFKEADLTWRLAAQTSYAAFVEFGTKSHVSIPPGLEAEAARFRNAKGGSLGAKQAIFNWCKRHGIDPKFWYAIFIKIMVQGVRPHPFFFKQLEIERPNLLARLNKIV